MTNQEHMLNMTKIIMKKKDYCYSCDKEYTKIDVPNGWDDEYCEDCNEMYSEYECKNCKNIVDEPDTFCGEYCYQEYWM